MYSIKQLEAFCWSAHLGSFTAAAKRLNASQSAIAKRVNELERFVGSPLFDRGPKSLQTTQAGLKLLSLGEELLAVHARVVRGMANISGFEGTLRIGATELIGLTWLPDLIQEIKQQFPNVLIEPEIDGGVKLYDQLARCGIDIALMPGPFSSPQFDSVNLGVVRNAWMASAQSDTAFPDQLTPDDIAELPVIVQPAHSALTQLYESWFKETGFLLNRVLPCNSLGMVAQLTMYGLGISYLPVDYFTAWINDERLRILNVRPALPPVSYFAFYRKNDPSLLISNVIEIAVAACNFESTI